MPSKSANVKNEKVREARGQGHVEGAGREDRELPEGLEAWRREVAQRVVDPRSGRLTSGDFDKVRTLIHDDVAFQGAMGSTHGADWYVTMG